MGPVHHEERFEAAITASLVQQGWHEGTNDGYHRDLALDMGEMFTFIGATQNDEWLRLSDYYGGADDIDGAQERFAEYVARQIDQRGALDVLRHGVKDRGILIRLAYFRPAHTIAEDALDDYLQNRLSVIRQLRYSTTDRGKELDLALFVNGIPVATAELKNPLTGQNVEHAKHQYRSDRDPKELLFAKRALVHFAVDPDSVFVTTKLTGENTAFLPFDTGSNGPGVSGGNGNPPSDHGYRTSYLWEQVWAPDAWLDLIRRFMHIEVPKERGRRKNIHDLPLIFPRFHQWHAVNNIVDHAASHGPGHNYLIQHSAGSGKSNTIAWLAHRLSSLHNEANETVFDKIIVITDRDVLDRQLQETIYQFEHTSGVVERIRRDSDGSKSAQVATALTNETSKIVIGTLQTFPYVLSQMSDMRAKQFAIIVDEAHSSQSGDSAAALKRVLLKLGSDDIDDDGNPLTASALARGRHQTLSYFAFTATPKAKTIELFGSTDPATGRKVAFHTYSMRQAIEEGFILDVLRNYVTYQMYFRLAKLDADDQEVDPRKARAQMVRFAELTPGSMQQRAEVIVDHFHTHVARRMGGRTKAMVVTRSREHAYKLYRAIVEYVDMRGYADCAPLVAFSGDLEIDGEKLTESKLNNFSANELPRRFAWTRADAPPAERDKAEYRILVVAEKYQTGYDQPLLTTMYVDKPLKGVAAVQTLSRLNRIHPPLKSQEDIFVLDLANDAEDIQNEFRPFYETTITEPTDPNILYESQRTVLDHQLLIESEMLAFVEAYFAGQKQALDDTRWQKAHAALYRYIDPAVVRFVERNEEDPENAEQFRSDLRDFIRKYGFLSQIIDNPDVDLEMLYLYGKFLFNKLPSGREPTLDIGELDLTHLRITKTGEHDVRLGVEGEHVLPGFTGDGAGPKHAPEKMSLSDLIEDFNAKHGMNLGESDLIQPMEAAAENPKIRAAALNNDEANFGHVFDTEFENNVYDRIEENSKFLKKFSDDDDFRADFTKLARRRAYEMIRRSVA